MRGASQFRRVGDVTPELVGLLLSKLIVQIAGSKATWADRRTIGKSRRIPIRLSALPAD